MLRQPTKSLSLFDALWREHRKANRVSPAPTTTYGMPSISFVIGPRDAPGSLLYPPPAVLRWVRPRCLRFAQAQQSPPLGFSARGARADHLVCPRIRRALLS